MLLEDEGALRATSRVALGSFRALLGVDGRRERRDARERAGCGFRYGIDILVDGTYVFIVFYYGRFVSRFSCGLDATEGN